MSTIWVEIDDLLHYLTHHNRPSGIQRVVFELSRAMHRLGAERVRFVRRGGGGPRDLAVVDWDEVEALFDAVTGEKAAPPRPAHEPPAAMAARRAGGSANGDDPLRAMLRAQGRALGAAARVPTGTLRHLHQAIRTRDERRARAEPAASRRELPISPLRLHHTARPGDTFLVVGSPWHHGDYNVTVRWLRDELRMVFALLMYDLVPVRHPEWCDRGIILTFSAWHRSVLPLADRIFAISHATARDVEAYAREQGLALAGAVEPIPLGTGFGPAEKDEAADEGAAEDPDDGAPLPAPGSYVLFVSTLEARKNHALLFRVWRRLAAEMPAEQLPTLVFAGRVGWLVSDLLQQLENAAWLGGRIRFVRDPTDRQLAQLYRGCLFTLFPSYFEGWGLPVTESLMFGRPCIASNTTSIPEAGGTLSRYFDPYSVADAAACIRAVLEDRDALARWQAEVATQFVPVPWTAGATALITSLDRYAGELAAAEQTGPA